MRAMEPKGGYEVGSGLMGVVQITMFIFEQPPLCEHPSFSREMVVVWSAGKT
jgi:hypothetical protein